MLQEVVAQQKAMITQVLPEHYASIGSSKQADGLAFYEKYETSVNNAIPVLHIRLLGNFRLASGETSVTDFDFPRLQSLLAYLLLHRDTPQSRSRLAFQLWPDSTDAQAHTNLRNVLFRLRQALPNADAFLHSDRQYIRWSFDAAWTLDVLEFEQALQQAEQSHDIVSARSALELAVTLYRGDLLPDCYDEWILPERDRLRQAYLGALYRLTNILEREGDYTAAIRVARRLLHQEPLQEETYRSLMRLHALNNDRASALRVYRSCVSTLERELGIEPEEATRTVYECIKQTDAPTTAYKTATVLALPPVDRQREWAQFQAIWRTIGNGESHMVWLSSDAGTGTTRLVEDFASWVSGQGMRVISTRCFSAMEQLAYAPLAMLLRSSALRPSLSQLATVWQTEIARLVPELLLEHPDILRPDTMQESWQQQWFFEALARALIVNQQPTLLVLDDAQWCDRETLIWLQYVLRFHPQAPLLIAITVRSDEIASEHPLMSLLTGLRRDGKVSEIEPGAVNDMKTRIYYDGQAQCQTCAC